MPFRLARIAPCAIGQRVTPRLTAIRRLPIVFLLMTSCSDLRNSALDTPAGVPERQVTRGPGGRILSNTGVWSPDSQWIVYDTRPDHEGSVFGGETIEMVNVVTGEVKELYRAKNGARCGVVTFHPHKWDVAFILGPEHVWDPVGEWVSFTYEDHVLAQFTSATPTNDINQRNLGVSVPGIPVRVPHANPRNHDGDHFTVLAARTTASPKPGSDEIKRACEEGWVGVNGYVRRDGARQEHALAFQGQVLSPKGETMSEVFIADLPDDVTQPGDGPLCGTETRAPYPPKGTVQRRLTFTADRRFPGIQGPRHWLRSSPDGSRIAFLMKDDAGVVQLWSVSPNGGPPKQVTRNPSPIVSAFTWSPDGRQIAYVMDNSVCVTDAESGRTTRLTRRTDDASAPRSEACVFSPDGKKIAFVRRLPSPESPANQICIVTLKSV